MNGKTTTKPAAESGRFAAGKWARKLLQLLLVTGGMGTLFFLLLLAHIKSLPYSYDERPFVGKNVEDIVNSVGGKWVDFSGKDFISHHDERGGCRVDVMQVGYRQTHDAKIITGISHSLRCEKYDTRWFEKYRYSDAAGSYERIRIWGWVRGWAQKEWEVN
jgi:hypothetical protein